MKLSIFAFVVFTLAQIGLVVKILLSYKRIQRYVRVSKIDALYKCIGNYERGLVIVSCIKVVIDNLLIYSIIDFALMVMTIIWLPIGCYKKKHALY